MVNPAGQLVTSVLFPNSSNGGGGGDDRCRAAVGSIPGDVMNLEPGLSFGWQERGSMALVLGNPDWCLAWPVLGTLWVEGWWLEEGPTTRCQEAARCVKTNPYLLGWFRGLEVLQVG